MRPYNCKDNKLDQITWQIGSAKIKKSKREVHDFYRQRLEFNLRMHKYAIRSLILLLILNMAFIFFEASTFRDTLAYLMVMNFIVVVAGLGLEKVKETIMKHDK